MGSHELPGSEGAGVGQALWSPRACRGPGREGAGE